MLAAKAKSAWPAVTRNKEIINPRLKIFNWLIPLADFVGNEAKDERHKNVRERIAGVEKVVLSAVDIQILYAVPFVKITRSISSSNGAGMS